MKSMRTIFAHHVLVLFAVLFSCCTAYTQSEWIVHSFNTPFGAVPLGNLVADGEGNLYGTTHTGGTKDWGVVYELVRPVPPKTSWTETVLYNFTGSPDGGKPEAGLLFDKSGNLYGTTNLGGAANVGTVFELSPPVTPGGKWTESVLHSFVSDSSDGRNPDTGLTWDHSGNLMESRRLVASTPRPPAGALAARCLNYRHLQHRAARGLNRSSRISSGDRESSREELQSSLRAAFSTVQLTEEESTGTALSISFSLPP
jgi:uncharacterized repeat protein (TIGR03803 family)